MSAICRPETGENMSAQKIFLGGAAPEPPRGGLRPPLTPLRARRRRSDTTTRAKNITHTQQIPLDDVIELNDFLFVLGLNKKLLLVSYMIDLHYVSKFDAQNLIVRYQTHVVVKHV
jgi:hypothetical protein